MRPPKAPGWLTLYIRHTLTGMASFVRTCLLGCAEPLARSRRRRPRRAIRGGDYGEAALQAARSRDRRPVRHLALDEHAVPQLLPRAARRPGERRSRRGRAEPALRRDAARRRRPPQGGGRRRRAPEGSRRPSRTSPPSRRRRCRRCAPPSRAAAWDLAGKQAGRACVGAARPAAPRGADVVHDRHRRARGDDRSRARGDAVRAPQGEAGFRRRRRAGATAGRRAAREALPLRRQRGLGPRAGGQGPRGPGRPRCGARRAAAAGRRRRGPGLAARTGHPYRSSPTRRCSASSSSTRSTSSTTAAW